MPRPRGFDEAAVVRAAAELFAGRGYGATSMDDLVAALGVQRGSLYRVFGSKSGLFRRALQDRLDPAVPIADGLDLLLVAAMELAASDHGVRALVVGGLGRLDRPAEAVLGRAVLRRAGLSPPTTQGERS